VRRFSYVDRRESTTELHDTTTIWDPLERDGGYYYSRGRLALHRYQQRSRTPPLKP